MELWVKNMVKYGEIWQPWVLYCRSNLWMTAKVLLALISYKSAWYRATLEYFEPTLLSNPFLRLMTFLNQQKVRIITFHFLVSSLIILPVSSFCCPLSALQSILSGTFCVLSLLFCFLALAVIHCVNCSTDIHPPVTVFLLCLLPQDPVPSQNLPLCVLPAACIAAGNSSDQTSRN